MAIKHLAERIPEYIDRIKRQKILIIGDLMLDRFIWGKVSRISPEAPVPVVQVTHESAYPGGAANVARNLADFGATAYICGITGQDAHGTTLRNILLKSNIHIDGVLQAPEYQTIIKTRIIARQQQVVRVDRESIRALTEDEIDKLVHLLTGIIPSIDAIIVEDYAKGLISQSLYSTIVSLAQKHHKIVAVDPNPKNPLDWTGATLVKPNRQEARLAMGLPYDADDGDIIEIGRTLQQRWHVPHLLITMGEDGMILFTSSKLPYQTPTKAREVYDVSGAGDTAIAFFTAALSAGISPQISAEIANHAAGVVVGKLGTATLTPDELLKSLIENHE